MKQKNSTLVTSTEKRGDEIDPFRMATRECIEIFHADFSYSNLLGIVKQNKCRVIFYLTQYATEEWQRFAVAHMLGHYFYHLSRSNQMRIYCQHYLPSDYSRKCEKEADQFACQLLMPAKKVSVFLGDRDRDRAAIIPIAKHFKVPTAIVPNHLKRLSAALKQGSESLVVS